MKLIDHNPGNICNINNVDITVPIGIKYVTISMYGRLEGWTVKPRISEGNWYSDKSNAILLAFVQREPEDEWTEVFDVKRNKWDDGF